MFRARYPLEGGPPQVKLHVAIIVQAISSTAGKGKGQGRLVLFDFLPAEPTGTNLVTSKRVCFPGLPSLFKTGIKAGTFPQKRRALYEVFLVYAHISPIGNHYCCRDLLFHRMESRLFCGEVPGMPIF